MDSFSNKIKVFELLYENLKNLYQDKDTELKRNKKITSTYYRNKSSEVHQLFGRESSKYQLFNICFYIFQVIFSQNTSDLLTLRVAEKIQYKLKEETFNLDSLKQILDFLEPFFYKHKERSKKAVESTAKLIIESITSNFPITLNALTNVPQIGLKTASIIYNHFFEKQLYPVIDVNVFKAYNKLVLEHFKEKTPDTFFYSLTRYDAVLEDKNFNRKSCELADFLWLHQKICKGKNCKEIDPCNHCKNLKKALI